jgi:hypothetical protein
MNGNATFTTGQFQQVNPVAPPQGSPVNPVESLNLQANGQNTPATTLTEGNGVNVMQGASEADKSAIVKLIEGQLENRKKYTQETKILSVYAMKINPRERVDGNADGEFPVRDIKKAIDSFQKKFGVTPEQFANPESITAVPAAASCTLDELKGFIKLLKDIEAGTVKGLKINYMAKEDFDKKEKTIKGVKLNRSGKDEVLKLKDLERRIVDNAAGLINTTVPTIQFQIWQSKGIKDIFGLKGATDSASKKVLKKKKSTTLRISHKKSLFENGGLIAEFVTVDKTKSTAKNPDEKISTYNFRSVNALKYWKAVDGKNREFTFRLSLDVPQFALKYSVKELESKGLGNTAEVPTIDLTSPESLQSIQNNLLEIYAAEQIKGVNTDLNSQINAIKAEDAKADREAAAKAVDGVDAV